MIIKYKKTVLLFIIVLFFIDGNRSLAITTIETENYKEAIEQLISTKNYYHYYDNTWSRKDKKLIRFPENFLHFNIKITEQELTKLLQKKYNEKISHKWIDNQGNTIAENSSSIYSKYFIGNKLPAIIAVEYNFQELDHLAMTSIYFNNSKFTFIEILKYLINKLGLPSSYDILKKQNILTISYEWANLNRKSPLGFIRLD